VNTGAGSVGISGSAKATPSASTPTGSTSASATGASASRADQEREVPIGRESQAQPRSNPRGSSGAAERGTAGAHYGTPFSFMRRFGEEMDRLFEDFGFVPPGLESELTLLGFPTPFGRSSVAVNANPRQVSSGSSSAAPRSGAVSRSPSSATASSASLANRGTSWMPQVEVLQRGNDLVVRADLPGLRREDVHVHLDDGLLTVSGERRYESAEEEDGVYHSERSYGRFSRSIPLPEGVDADACEAKFNDGVLEVRVPIPAQESRSRRIEVR